MPRFDHDLASRDDVIDAEALRLWRRLAEIRQKISRTLPDPAHSPVLTQLELASVPDSIALLVLECYHYIMSFRAESIHLGLFERDEYFPWTLISLSPFDLRNLSPEFHGFGDSSLVVSRVYAFPGVPSNAISFTLARVRRWLAVNRPDIRYLVTYCNPNLGFTGASYKADNWHLVGYEHGARYTYLDGNYITDRRVFQLFGQAPDEIACESPYNRLTLSKWVLQPLCLYLRRVHESRDEHAREPLHFDRWLPGLP